MYVRYDSLNRHEPLTMILCNPGSVYSESNFAPTKVIGILIDTSEEELCMNFNQVSELNFRVTRVHREDHDEDNHAYNLYKAIQPRRLIYVAGIGYFIISSIGEGYDDAGNHYKDIVASSIEMELQNRKIPYIADSTYRFLSDDANNTTGLLEMLVATIPLWTIGYVDNAVASKFRTFEDIDTSLNMHAFMIENMQDAYECIFVFDVIRRIINVYDQNNYVRQTDIHITKEDLIRSIDITENADNLYTAISVLGDENVTISAINPLGGNVIYNFDNYLDWMSDGLRTKVIAWQNAVESNKQSYYDMNLRYYTKLEQASNYHMELQKIAAQITMYRRCRDNIVAESSTDLVGSYNTVIVENGGTPIEVYEEIGQVLAEIDNLIALCEDTQEDTTTLLDAVNAELSTLKDSISAVHTSLSMTNYFFASEYEELCNYIYEGSYTDEYVVITDIMSYPEKFEQMKVLYDRAEITLEKASKPTQEFNIDVENFIFVKEFEHWSEQLETGCLINVELEQDEVALLFLSNITVNYDDHTLSMTFGNRFTKFDPKSLFEDVLGNISKSANTLNYIKDVLYPIKNGELNYMREALDASRNLTMQAALSSTDEEVIIDGSGYTGKKKLENGTYDPRQVKITGKSIVFTNDAWETCKVAIGEILLGDNETAYGVNAEVLIGDIIMGNNLHILDNEGNDLLTVTDNKIASKVSDVIYGDADQLQSDGSDSIIKKIAAVEQTADGINIIVEQIAVENADGTYSVDVDQVTTRTGYTFNQDGLTIYKSGEEIKNLLDNTGMYVTRSGEEILTANNEGVRAINLTAKQYLIIGENSRLENYSNGTDTKRTACFYIGG